MVEAGLVLGLALLLDRMLASISVSRTICNAVAHFTGLHEERQIDHTA